MPQDGHIRTTAAIADWVKCMMPSTATYEQQQDAGLCYFAPPNIGPFGRTFGCELEFPTRKGRDELIQQLIDRGHRVETQTRRYTKEVTKGWKVVWDRSINGNGAGWELVSPVLSGPEGLAEVMKMCESLDALKCEIERGNTTCGFHVHIGARDLDGDAVAHLIRFHHHAEYRCGLIYCVPPSRRDNVYCKQTLPEILERARTGPITFEEVRQIAVEHYGNEHDARYVALNMFENCATIGTVEFRRHSGTLNGEKCVAWILLCLCMVSASKKLGWSGYGGNLKECLDAIGMSGNELCKWAEKFLLARQNHFQNGLPEDYPVFPAKDFFLEIAEAARLDRMDDA